MYKWITSNKRHNFFFLLWEIIYIDCMNYVYDNLLLKLVKKKIAYIKSQQVIFNRYIRKFILLYKRYFVIL
ncbi:hypothetical protein BUY60_09145 [Staphylococcus epidermidis]|nr:hypothetical protein BUY60_09145 [Staphylococcus epidermidis]